MHFGTSKVNEILVWSYHSKVCDHIWLANTNEQSIGCIFRILNFTGFIPRIVATCSVHVEKLLSEQDAQRVSYAHAEHTVNRQPSHVCGTRRAHEDTKQCSKYNFIFQNFKLKYYFTDKTFETFLNCYLHVVKCSISKTCDVFNLWTGTSFKHAIIIRITDDFNHFQNMRFQALPDKGCRFQTTFSHFSREFVKMTECHSLLKIGNRFIFKN
jgi:hypothetical protein